MIIEDSYDDFISGVADSRKLEKSEVDIVAQGQVWSGQDALDHGLIDELGNYDDAIIAAAELAGLEEGAFGRKIFEPGLSATEQLVIDLLSIIKNLGFDTTAISMNNSLIEDFLQDLQEKISKLSNFNDPKGIYSHCFCEME